MIEQDTVKLFRDCDTGIEMGIDSINDVLNYVSSPEFRRVLSENKDEHAVLKSEIEAALNRFHDDGKSPSPVAQTMSWMKASMKLGMKDSDETIADLMTDGCNMGVKSLSRYLNQYAAADEKSKDIAKRLINLEHQLSVDIRDFL